MLRREQNDLLTRTGPGTPMGRLFRCYWTAGPAGRGAAENDCPPVRVKLLSERLVAFRDSRGTLWADRRVLSRIAALRCGSAATRSAGCAVRITAGNSTLTGQCIEVPSEPEESGFAKKIKLQSYPLVERGGVLWTYMGPPERKPPLPEWEFALVPPSSASSPSGSQECNWLQAMEGGIDSSHVSFLHRGDIDSDPLFKGAKGNQYNLQDARPVFEVVESAGGLYIGARRNAEDGNYYWRITQYVLPSFTMIAPRGDHTVHGHFWIPIDDDNCWAWSYDYHPTRDITDAERHAMGDGKGIHCKVHTGHLPAGRQQGQRLSDGPRRAAARRQLQRHRGHRDPGRLAAGKHGADRRPHQGKSGLDRQRHHHGAAPADARRAGTGRRKASCRPASISPTRRCARPR